MSKRNIKIVCGVSIAVVMAVLIGSGLLFKLFTPVNPEFHSGITEIFDGCYIEDLDDDMVSMYYYSDENEEDKKYIVYEWEKIIKYASNGKDTVAFHCIYNYNEENEEDKFVVFNTATEKEISFHSQKEFIDYCKEEKINLSDWQYHHRAYEKIDLGNGWYIYNNLDNIYHDVIYKGAEVVYEGYTDCVEKKENGCVEFVFAVSYGEELEISSSNSNLDISDKVIGEYKYTLFATDDVCYHEKLMLDTTTGEVTVISDKE